MGPGIAMIFTALLAALATADGSANFVNCTVEYRSTATGELTSYEGQEPPGMYPVVTVDPLYKTLMVLQCFTTEVIIDPQYEYDHLEVLDVDGDMPRMPENINKLKKLVVLDLCENFIELLDLNQFQGFEQLRKVNVAHNQLTSVSLTEHLELPSLEELYLHNNKLTALDLRLLQANKLQRLFVSQNQLVRVEGFPQGYHNLKRVDFYLNRWNCAWLEETLHLLEQQKVELLSYWPEAICDDRGTVKVSGVSCEPDEEETQVLE